MTRLPAVLLLALAGPAAGATDAWVKPVLRDALERAIYDYEVAGYCGLAGPAVEAGLAAIVARLRREAGLDAAALDRARAQAWKAARWEWENRGLGGFRAWCRGEGRAAAARLAGQR